MDLSHTYKKKAKYDESSVKVLLYLEVPGPLAFPVP